MNTYAPIETELGILKGRDCIYLDETIIKDGQNTLILSGGINGNLCSKKQIGTEIPYELIFKGILALKMVELDSWNFVSKSSFDEIQNSSWIKKLGGKVTTKHRHFLVQTYDEVFEVVCSNFVFKLKKA